MPLTLFIRNADRLDNGSPLSIVLDKRGALIGRAATTDWCLPDPSLHVSSRHCEVRFSGGNYELIDHSTNGTFLDGQAARLAGPHLISPGDVFRVGNYEIAASLDDAAAAQAAERNANPAPANWKGWTGGNDDAAPPASGASWDARPTGSAISGTGPMSQSWAAPPTAPTPAAGPSPTPGASAGWGPASAPPPPADFPPAALPPAASDWRAPTAPITGADPNGWGASPTSTPAADSGPASSWGVSTPVPLKPASDWSSPAAPPPPPAADDIWGKFSQSNVVDWARGGFGASQAAPTPVFTPTPTPPPPVAAPQPPLPAPMPAPQPVSPPPAPVHAANGQSLATLAQAAGVNTAKLQSGEAQTLGRAGSLLLRLVAGMVVMLEARARAKSQLGAQGTSLEFDGNNPLKFARTPEQALEQLLNEPQRGFMDSERAVEDAFKDLQANQMATLTAMQGALRHTLDQFSPRAIRSRAEQGGFLSRILPGARDAALWNAYEREFSGVAHGSDEAFMEIFAKEFRRAYEDISRRR